MLGQLQADASGEALTELEQLRERLDYGTAKQQGQPLGSGPMESPCRQYQVRFKRTRQFWTQEGDETLMCLGTFRRNDRWHFLFPRAAGSDPSKN